jgi:hypothetical protein
MDELNLEIKEIDMAIDEFCKEMKAKMADKAVVGYRGWREMPIETIRFKLLQHVLKTHYSHFFDSQAVDIANFCMMLWLKERGVKDDPDK